jgi:hypothetical protein
MVPSLLLKVKSNPIQPQSFVNGLNRCVSGSNLCSFERILMSKVARASKLQMRQPSILLCDNPLVFGSEVSSEVFIFGDAFPELGAIALTDVYLLIARLAAESDINVSRVGPTTIGYALA